jgi:SnoaL-like domain
VSTVRPAAEVADVLAIRETLAWYMRAMRIKDLDLMDDVFTPDAIIDYTAIGGTPGPWPEVKQWLGGMVLGVEFFSLYVGDIYPAFRTVDGHDRSAATVESTWHGVFVAAPGAVPLIVFGSYTDEFVRTADGWRIAKRTDQPAIQVPAGGAST